MIAIIAATLIVIAITAALIILGNVTESIELRGASWIGAYVIGAHGLRWCIKAWMEERRHKSSPCEGINQPRGFQREQPAANAITDNLPRSTEGRRAHASS